MRPIAIMLAAAAMLSGLPAQAADSGDTTIVEKVSGLDEPVPARTTMGVIHNIDYAKRQATIGGYIYDFGPPGLPIKITLNGGGNGAFELLQPGMKVRVTYGELDSARIAVVVEELGDDQFVDY